MHQLAIATSLGAIVLASTANLALAAKSQFGSEAEARAMLQKAVTAVKDDKGKALEMFNKGEGGFRDRRSDRYDEDTYAEQHELKMAVKEAVGRWTRSC